MYDIASAIIEVHNTSPSQAKNAYSATLLIPGYQSLRFHPLLQPFRRVRNTSVEKYAAFWSPAPLLEQMAAEPNPSDLISVRNRLLLALRLFMLHRSIDLSRMLRSITFQQGQPFILIRRKVGTLINGNNLLF